MDATLQEIRQKSLGNLQIEAKQLYPEGLAKLEDFLNSLTLPERTTCLRACTMLFKVTNGKIPRQFQLEATLATISKRDSIVIAGTGAGKTVCILLPLLLSPDRISIMISPLKRLQINQVSKNVLSGFYSIDFDSDRFSSSRNLEFTLSRSTKTPRRMMCIGT